MIKLTAIGHLGKDVVINTVSGKSVMNFTVCHSEKFKDAQGVQKEKSVWIDCNYWNDKTAVAQYLKKGTQVYVEGTPDVRAYVNQQGSPSGIITLRVSSIQLLGSGNNANNNTTVVNTPVQNNAVASNSVFNTNIESPEDESLPF